jgi:Bacterial Ig-like domain (group 3)
MKHRISAAVAGAATLAATTAGIVLLGATAANAAAPPWEPDSANEAGTIAFFNSSGVQINHGNVSDAPFAAYAVGSALPRACDTKAKLEYALPDPGNSKPATWTVAGVSAIANSFPVSGSPSDISSLSATTPVVKGAAIDSTIETDIFQLPNTGPTGDADGASGCPYAANVSLCTNASYENLYQIRLVSTDGNSDSATYDAADILVNGATGAWTQVFGSTIATTTSVVATPNPQGAGASVTLAATVTDADASAPAGTVTFTSGGATLGSSSSFSGSGVATATTTALPQGNDTITATFVPAASTFTGSSGTTSEHINAPVPGTTTTLGISGDSTTGTDAILSGTVSPATAGGTVSLFDGSSTTALNSSPVAVTSGAYTFTLTGGFAAGTHSVVAKFTPADPTQFAASQSAPVGFNTILGAAAGSTCSQTGSKCSDTQTIEGTIPTGTLVISTPYTDANPLNLGTLALSADGTEWTGSAAFKCITITDASSGGSPFVASALANPLSQVPGTGNPAQNTTNSSTTINGENVGLTNLVLSAAGGTTVTCPDGSTPTESYTGGRTVANNPAANGVSPSDTGSAGLGGSTPHTIITGSAGGEGTVAYDGTLTLNAPTSTAAGTYKGTVIFTVTD